MAYIGYFRSLHKNKLYSVTIKKKSDTTEPIEITMAGENPFVVRYENNDTPFEPIRNSTATISVVSDHYFEDVLPNKAMETEVILKDETTLEKIWVGYLTPKVYSQPYENCLETIELEASDCLSVIQYGDYLSEGNRGIITFKDVIVRCIDSTMLKGFYWPLTKKVDGSYVYPTELKISEMNFYSSDTDEPWNSQDVIKEMCSYLGMTAIQKGEYLYFADYTALNNADRYTFASYLKNVNYAQGSSVYSGEKRKITNKEILGSGGSIDFDPVYNKFTVKDNFYACEEFISNIFQDNLLTNRGGDFFSSIEIDAFTTKATYPWGTKWFNQKYTEDEDDTKYLYFHRLYDHKDYESIYRYDNTLSKTQPTSDLNTGKITQDYVGGTIMDFGRVKKEYVNEAYQTIISNQIDWERYLCINLLGEGWWIYNNNYVPKGPQDNMVIFRLKEGSTGQVLMNSNSYLIINYKLLFTKYKLRNYINPDWTTDTANMSAWESGTQIESSGKMAFRLGIGGKYWNGSSWQTSPCTFSITCAREEDEYAYFNEEKGVLNNVSWELNIDEEGYKIPLEGVDTAGELVFDFFLPSIQLITDYDDLEPTNYNGYCWIKDFSIKTATIGQDKQVEESDVVYENVIDSENVNSMSEITLKFTTSVPNSKPSYSNVLFFKNNTNTFLEDVKEDGLDGDAQKAEENIIQRYYQQYSTPTKKLSYHLSIDCGLFDKYYGVDVDNPDTGYVQLGTEINYATDTQEIILIEKK
jgi:hypothetical protein